METVRPPGSIGGSAKKALKHREIFRKPSFSTAWLPPDGMGTAMKLEIRSGEQHTTADISGVSGNRVVSIGTHQAKCDWMRLPDGRYSVIIDGKVFDLAVEAEGDSVLVAGREGICKFQVRDPRRVLAQKIPEEGTAGIHRLRADMPGKVIRVLVRKGDVVACGQALLVIEAMKMQNEIRAPKAGIIKDISVVEGRTVNSGESLLSVE